MSKPNILVGSTKENSKLVRAKFGPGMLLQHDDLELLNEHPRELSRLLFKSFFGCGVICGLTVSAETKCEKLAVKVGSGVALACSGDPIHVPKDVTVLTNEKFDPENMRELWVVLCGTVKHCAPRTAVCADDDEAPAMSTREKDGFEIRLLTDRCDCACGCPTPKSPIVEVKDNDCKCVVPYQPNQPPARNCYDDHYDGKCGCQCDDCTDCDCQCVLLARLVLNRDKQPPWRADYRVRRFIRPVLMRDPEVKPEVRADGGGVKPDPVKPGADTTKAPPASEAQPELALLEQEGELKESALKAEIEQRLNEEAQLQRIIAPPPPVKAATEPVPEQAPAVAVVAKRSRTKSS